MTIINIDFSLTQVDKRCSKHLKSHPLFHFQENKKKEKTKQKQKNTIWNIFLQQLIIIHFSLQLQHLQVQYRKKLLRKLVFLPMNQKWNFEIMNHLHQQLNNFLEEGPRLIPRMPSPPLFFPTGEIVTRCQTAQLTQSYHKYSEIHSDL